MEVCGDWFDVIVVGAGIMGSCTAYEVAKRGHKALLLEKFDFLHHLGSSHGESRTIRATYPEDYYASMVLESYRLWEEAQSEIGYRVLTRTSHFDMGPAANKSLQCAIANCEPNSINARILDRSQLHDMFSGVIQLPEQWIGVETDVGGVIKPTKAVAMFQALAIRRGAVLRDHMEVKDIGRDEAGGGIWVSTASGERFRGRKCVLTVGAWMRKLVKEVSGLDLPIQPLHTTVCYWKIKEGHEDEFSPKAGFPTFASYGEPYVYGTPSMEFPGLIKIAMHGGHPCDPDRRDWASGSGVLVDPVVPWIEQVLLPGSVEAGKPVMKQACLYSMTPDGDFIIDFLGGEFGKDVVVAGGFSGHGFKMGPAVGRILAEMAIDGKVAGFELKQFRLGRFEEDPKGNAKEFEDQVAFHVNP
ncbi:probable sarcosine oxidase [Phoenix dactylifera]|uniref:sarcosine oxidasee (formaldehyde-forming) n=1 Tax=Phoenix dactylifera TaxID=42345 RepID=A0A8B7D224_PHODC|nr:probable sarcosine oxidase [Phoenix dactylifera]